MSELNVLLLKLFHIVVRAFLVLASALWLLILLELLPVLAYGGMEDVHGKLLHIWSMGKIDFDLPWTCENSLRPVHEGYTDIILFLLLTLGCPGAKAVFTASDSGIWPAFPDFHRYSLRFAILKGYSNN